MIRAILLTILLGLARVAIAAPDEPYDPGLAYTADIFSNLKGGERRGTAWLDNLDLTLAIDADKAWGIPRTDVFIYGLYNNGSRFSDGIVGDAQVASNIETDVRAARLYEAWIEHRFGRASLRAGLYDLNAEFDAIDPASLFLNSAQGIGTDFGQTGRNGPSIFPVTSPGARLELTGGHWLLRSAVLDAVPGDPDDPGATRIELGNGTLWSTELNFAKGQARYAVGYWRYASQLPDLGSGHLRTGNDGWYGFAVHSFEGPGAAAYIRIGEAHRPSTSSVAISARDWSGRASRAGPKIPLALLWRGRARALPGDRLPVVSGGRSRLRPHGLCTLMILSACSLISSILWTRAPTPISPTRGLRVCESSFPSTRRSRDTPARTYCREYLRAHRRALPGW